MLLRCLRWGLAGVLAGMLLTLTVFRAFGLEREWPLVPLFAFTPHLAVLALAGACFAAWSRWWPEAVVTGACAAILLVLLAPRVIPNRAPADAPGVRLRVLAANVAGNDAAAQQVLEAVRRWDIDVFSAIELTPEVALAYDADGAQRLFPYRVLNPQPGYRGTGLYSRRPLQKRWPPLAVDFGLSAARLRLPGAAPVDVLAIHVPAPTTRLASRRWRHDMRELPSAGAAAATRVLAGDFNATLDHAELRRLLDRGYRDAAEQAGTGLRPTWPAGRQLVPTLVTIDHVLADRRVRVISARSVEIPGSDHRGVLAELLLPRR